MRIFVALALLLVIAPRDASAEGDFDWRLPDRSYWWDGGIVPFLYLPMAFTFTTQDPRSEPLGFDAREGGAVYNGGQYPVVMLYVDAAVAGGVMFFGGDDSRWHHAKGFVEALFTTSMLTTLAKNTFGRHRPHYDLTPGAVNDTDLRRSFWSGHSSSTFVTATYLGLYARKHLFNRWRPAGTLPWWEGAAYVGLAAAAVAVPYSQYALHRHFATDVITGSAVGAGVATLFFVYQERRYRRSKRAAQQSEPEPMTLSIMPNTSINGVSVLGTW